MNPTYTKLKPVLYAEDDEDDVLLLRRAFNKLGLKNPLTHVSNGNLAIDYLSGAKPYEDRDANPLPCLVVLDLKMPGKNGIEVLRWIQTQPTVVGIPAVVLSSTDLKSHIQEAYLLGAYGFFIKPVQAEELFGIVSAMSQSWLELQPARTGFSDISAFRGR